MLKSCWLFVSKTENAGSPWSSRGGIIEVLSIFIIIVFTSSGYPAWILFRTVLPKILSYDHNCQLQQNKRRFIKQKCHFFKYSTFPAAV